MTAGYKVSVADWHKDTEQLRAIREAVFISEQHVPKSLEWDASDPECTHVIAIDDDGVSIATGRLVPDGSIGRMAVLKAWRGRGVGNAIMEKLVDEARRNGFRSLKLSSQEHAVGFYQRHGFVAQGTPYMEAGIRHITMIRDEL